MNDICYRNNCLGISVILSILVGAVVAIISFGTGLILSPLFSGAAILIALIALLITLIIAVFGDRDSSCCLSRVFPAVVTGIFGAILTAVILLLIPADTAILVTAVFTGLLLAFLTLILTVSVCFIKCVISE